MSGEHKGGYDWMAGLGMMIAAPVVLLAGAVVVVVLSAPIIMVLSVIAFATVILFAGTVLTRETPSTDTTEREEAMCESADLFVALESENIAMVESLIDAPKTPVSATITKVVGPCPLGLMPGNNWTIDPDGKLSRPMCRPGATALSALFRMANGDVMDRPVCCECEIAGREVTFTVREPV
ncbi:MAG: hypothetical protein BZY87_01030 [SAR202 cluster bacterium Io17-Chloro-G6]|nr:MAG: hypothetical protein BZY87_01030 [SAR202 cluster bacterium Io17-Chloro-G6]